jgi:hypothetical protein
MVPLSGMIVAFASCSDQPISYEQQPPPAQSRERYSARVKALRQSVEGLRPVR